MAALAWVVPALALAAAVVPDEGPGWAREARSALIRRCRFAETPADDAEQLALWAREHLPRGARVVGPPGIKTFRLWSRRPVAFNRASSPYHAAGLADWAARFADHVAFEGPPSAFARAYLADRHALERRYDAMTDAELAGLARRQGAGYVLTGTAREDHATGDGPLERLRGEGRYTLFRVRDRLASGPGGQPGEARLQ